MKIKYIFVINWLVSCLLRIHFECVFDRAEFIMPSVLIINNRNNISELRKLMFLIFSCIFLPICIILHNLLLVHYLIIMHHISAIAQTNITYMGTLEKLVSHRCKSHATTYKPQIHYTSSP